jgi:putative redox protein
MVEIRIRYEGALRCAAQHVPSANELVTDAPLDNRGRGESFSPTDLVATALGTCMLTIMGIRAQQHGWSLEGATVLVRKGMAADLPRRIGRLDVKIEVPGSFDAEARRELEQAASTCPVALSIHPSIQVVLDFEWRDSAVPG